MIRASEARVLVLGSDTRSFLSVVRSLGRHQIEVHSAWTDPKSIAASSRFLKQTHEISKPEGGNVDWICQLNRLQSEYRYQLVIPCNDQSVIPIRSHRKQIDHYESYYILDDQAFEITSSKSRSFELARSLGVPVPHGKNDVELSDAKSITDELGFPLILKPESSFLLDQLSRKQNVQTVFSQDQLQSTLRRMREKGSVQIQQYFKGVGTGIEFLAVDGKVLRVFQHLRLHEPPGGGGSSYRKSISLHPGMLHAATDLLKSLNYSGVGMIEFLWNRSTDEWRFVEINGRFWGSLPLAVFSGADFPADLYRWRVQGKVNFPEVYREGVHSRNLTADKNWLSDFLRSRESSLVKKTALLGRGAIGILGRVLLGKEHVDTFAWDDPKPFFKEIASIAGSVYTGGKRKLRMRLRENRFVRNRIRKRLFLKMGCAKSILFVCKGNICRSPFAERYARSVMPSDLTIKSSGYFPTSGRPSPDAAVLIAKNFGVDLASHRSSSIDEFELDKFDIIFVFDDENHDEVQLRSCGEREKIFFLGCCSTTATHISDPYGGTQARFQQTYEEIQECMDRLAQCFTPSPDDA
ncbi:hypothetical protein NHH03_12185 [Stieleria sp. TO1_6]|nr:hypothetical protein [Stieleria tagensis]